MISGLELIKSIPYYFQYRKRFEKIPGFIEFSNKENENLMVLSVRMLCFIGCILYPAVGILEYWLYPELFWLFAFLRLIFAIACLTCAGLTYTAWGRKHAGEMIFVAALFGELIISFMIQQLSGWSSLYFVGNILVTNAMAMFIPWRPRVGLLYCALSLLGYIVIVRMRHEFSPEMMIPVTFITVNSLLSYFSRRTSEMSRLKQWSLRLETERAHQELQRVHEIKDKFFSNISHELRTPLTLIIGPLGSLARRGGGWISVELVASMVSNAQRLLRQVNSLLDLGKIDSHQMKSHIEVGNYRDLLLDLHRASVPAAYDRGISMELSVPDKLESSKFDFEKVETILANLISNAIKFTPHGGKITLHAQMTKENSFIQFSVTDSGTGIALDQQKLVFERFQQVQGAYSEVSKGSGLGLSVAKEFTELLGGKIWFESKIGSGTSFFVELPFIHAEAPLAPEMLPLFKPRDEMRMTLLSDVNKREQKDPTATEIRDDNRKRILSRTPDRAVILYVDDSADLRRYVDSILSNTYTVLLAADGEQGLEEARKYQPDLILSDVTMPKRNGFEFCRALRLDSQLRLTPFILLTANSSLDSRIEGFEEGADDHLSKPFSEREILSRIKNLIMLRQQAQIIRRQVDEAQKLQRLLLPPFSQNILSFKIEAIYQASQTLSGDFFDTISAGNWVYVYLAQVGSSGIAAAQITYLVREMIRSALTEEKDLDVLFEIIRRKYIERSLEYTLCLQLMRIHSRTGEIEFIKSKAANPVVVTEFCEVTEKRLSDTEAAPMVNRFKLEPDTKMYFYSAGAQAFKTLEGQEFGAERLHQAFAGTHFLMWPEGLLSALKLETGSKGFSEDVTILRIGYNEKSRGF